MTSFMEQAIAPQPGESPHPIDAQQAILEFVEKVETLSLFQERIEKPAQLPQVWQAFQAEIEHQISPAAMALFLVDPETHAFELSQWLPPEIEKTCRGEIDAQIECGTFAWIVNRRQPAVIPSIVFSGTRTLVMLPLATHTRTLGIAMIVAAIEENAITHERLRLLGILSKQCALVMENTLLYEQLRAEHESLQAAQAQIIQSEKFAALGRLTSGAFHELLNPLNIISGHLQIMMLEQDLPPSWSAYLKLMKSGSDRIATIVNHLLSFSGQRHKNSDEIDIVGTLRQVVADAVKQRAAKRVGVEFTFEKDLPPVSVNAEDLKTVIHHLVDNACDAMPEGGKLCVAVRYAPIDSGVAPHQKVVIIDIADSGRGIAAKNLHKVFDPFFTTKDIGEGMGLSLAISYALVRSMGGTITFESHVNDGTVFSIQLPVADDSH